jgi:ParB/RepB/Spo0J family partition protein
MKVTTIAVGRLEANDWNPNQMSEEEFAELVAEIRHLGRLPKPLIVRPDGDRYVIVDGEHAWRAGQEVGLEQVACEVIDADDFEAMRQTYKRNRHGTHNPVLLGRMLKRMLAERGLSRRALADEMEVSEGTIRNALLYADAADARRESDEEVRNGYAQGGDTTRESVAKLTVRQVRQYLDLPEVIRDAWLDSGADEAEVVRALSVDVHWPGQGGERFVHLSGEGDPFQEVVDAGLGDLFASRGFVHAARRAFEMLVWRSAFEQHLGGDVDAYLAPVVEVLKTSWRILPDELLHQLPLREQPDSGWPRRLCCPLTPERWATVLQEAINGDSGFVESRFRAGLKLALKELDAWDAASSDWENAEDRDPENRLALFDAPAFICDARMSTRDKVSLARAAFAGASEEELLEVKRAAIPLLEQKHQLMNDGYGYVDADGRGVGPMKGGSPLWEITPDKIVSGHFEKRRKQEEVEGRKALYESREALVAAILEQLSSKLYAPWRDEPATADEIEQLKRETDDPRAETLKVGDTIRKRGPAVTKDGREAVEVLVEHLNELPWPELVLLACVVTGEGDPGEVWLRALDSRDPATRGRRRSSLKDKERLVELGARFRRMEARVR